MSRISGQAFAQSYVELHKVKAVQFGLLNPDEVRKMSVVNITNERTYDDRGIPNYNGINDPRMGTMDRELKCFTCRGSQADCPGHFGHIELARPVYHAGLLEFIRKVLRCVCFYCSKLLADKEKLEEIKRIKTSSAKLAKALKLCDGVKQCKECLHKQPKFSKTGLKIQIEYAEDQQEGGRDRKQFLQPDEAHKVFERIDSESCALMGFNAKVSRPENMIIKNLAVAPPPVRPSVSMGNTMRSEDDLTYCYMKILQTNMALQQQIQRGANLTTINVLRESLQYYVATLMDNEIQGQPTQKHKSGKALKAIRSRLRGKEGRLRGNLMGKRVDFSARTVITPDPNLRLDQLGVPEKIALNLTVPETVTAENIDYMRRLVVNGPTQWPGAKYIIRHDDRQIDLSQLKNRSDLHIEPGFKVERHLANDDYVIFNRQPSLHKMSLMGHRVKVLPFSTFRLNLSVTTPYNADFDGDEMNMHVPQSYETKAEIKEIMAVPNQIVSPQSNKPVMGIVQDSLLGVMLFTLRDTFLEKEQVMQLLMWIEYSEDSLPHPVILKPKPLWTGKQIFSLIIPDINIQKVGEKNGKKLNNVWDSPGDHNILIRKGELICGNLTKGTIGNSSGGMIHVTWKEKGPYCTRDFMSNTQLIINNWLHQNGFTVGVQDIIAKKEIVQKIEEAMVEFKKSVQKISQKAWMGILKTQPGKGMMDSFEASVNQCLNKARDDCGNMALADLQSWNRLKAMVYAGSKGSNLNISQIMACVGQQNVEGKRIPFGFHRRSLPHFAKDDFGPESKGFVENCYLKGLTPQEFFFHAMGGREGLIDTAVKTAETGYIQRRLIKALEDVMVKYDGTVRTSKEQIIQFIYGEDGMAGEHIEDMTIPLLKVHNKDMSKKYDFYQKPRPDLSENEMKQHLSKFMEPQIAEEVINDPIIEVALRNELAQINKDREDLRFSILKCQDDSIHLPVNVPRIIWNAKEQFKIKPNNQSNLKPVYVLQELNKMMEDLAPIPGVKIKNDPLIIEANRDSTWLFKIYLRSLLNCKQVIQYERLSKESFDWILGEIKSRFDQALVNPGEMVGSIGAQSMGEPATQMTLNTFHFAGVSAKNVTLGVPRLKEIINIAKNIKTPSMKIYLVDEIKQNQKVATQFGGRIEHTTLSHVVKNSAIYYDPDPERTIIEEDVDLINLYNEVAIVDNERRAKMSSWVLRFELDGEKMLFKDLWMNMIEQKIQEYFQDQINVVHSDDNDSRLVLRLRFNDLEEDEEDSTVCIFLKEFQDKLFNELALKGLPEITKVTFSKYNDEIWATKESEMKKTKKDDKKEIGAADHEKDCWLIETDGVALQKVLGFPGINHKRTVSNDLIEILKVLGIEAVRMSLINELRFVLSSYGIYVNYRHLSTLCDVMTQRGILTAITRHGINRVDSGPLRKCSFEETVEILLEAAVFAETDPLRGITENIIMGQLAPYGTGFFDLIIDTKTLNDYAQLKNDDDDHNMGGFTPKQNDYYDDQMDDYGVSTPIIGNTPAPYHGGMSEYSSMNTPNYQGGFSPGPNTFGSPGYQTPGYMSSYAQSPGYGRAGPSPIYGQSPIYNAGNVPQSPTQGYNSPIYSPTTQTRGGAMSPGYQSQSPGYYNTAGGLSSKSPQYSSTLSGYQQSYSPTANHGYTGGQSSPHYTRSPSYQNSYSPNYSPTSQGVANTPRYNMGSSRYGAGESGHMSNASPGGYGANSTLYVPRSPSYATNTSPAYNATPQGAYSSVHGQTGPTYNPGGSPIDDEEDRK